MTRPPPRGAGDSRRHPLFRLRARELHATAIAVPTGGTTLAILDRETRSFHAAADRGWHRLLHGGDASRDDYVHQLVSAYGFESPFEDACAYTPGFAQALDLRGRWRCGLVVQDLLTLGWTADEITNIRRYKLTPFQDAASAGLDVRR